VAVLKSQYGTLVDMAPNLGALANAAAYETNIVDNETDRWVDAYVFAKLVSHETSTPTGEKAVRLYVYGALDNTEPTTEGTDGTEGTFTLSDASHFFPLGSAYFTAAAQTQEVGPFSVLSALRAPALPPFWGVALVNKTGFALDATDADHAVKFRPVYFDIV
jgi:hypothetical protein